MQTQTMRSISTPMPNCLGCRDCAGMCRALIEMASLPEILLRPSGGPT